MRLDITNANIVSLLSALRNTESVLKLSADDRQVIYSAEKLKTVRLCILLADYSKLLREIEDLELRELAEVARDELFLIKRSIGFYCTLKNISNCLKSGTAPITTHHTYVSSIPCINIAFMVFCVNTYVLCVSCALIVQVTL